MMLRLALSLWLLLGSISRADQPLFTNSDFESGTLEGWSVEGEAFQNQPTLGDNSAARGRESSNLQGDYWVGGYEKYNRRVGQPGATAGDRLTGTLTSAPFVIKQPYITYLVGGGNLPGQVGVRLLCEGREVELSSGIDSEGMIRRGSDVSAYLNKTAQLQVYDFATGGWGHINVDDFRGADSAPEDTSQRFAFTLDISPQAYPDTTYDQPLRPQFHFTSKRNWLNDPNGMVYYDGRYHLFFQHNPKAPVWGNMTWGHATSSDMIHWDQQDHALLPYRIDGRSGTIFSGTAIVDHNNSLGKQVGDTKTLCAFFTFASQPRFYQAMAYSTDGGDTWSYWNEGRPVVANQGFDSGERDPKVFWHEPSQRWVMVLWVQRDPGRIRFFTSKNLTDWQFASDMMRPWAFECMDLIPLDIDGDPGKQRWVIYDASFDYEIGTFDGTEFHSESPALQAGRGNFYAAQTFNNAPDQNAVQIGWMRGGPNAAQEYGVPFNQQMSFPCELSLRTTPKGVRLFAWPVEEIQKLYHDSFRIGPGQVEAGVNVLGEVNELDAIDLEIRFTPPSNGQVMFELPHVSMRYDSKSGQLSHTGVDDEGHAKEVVTLEGLEPRDGGVVLRLLVDRLSVEAYAWDGEQFAAHYIAPQGRRTASIHSVGGSLKIQSCDLRELGTIWR